MAKDQTEDVELELKRLELEEKRIDLEAKKVRMELDRMQLATVKQEVETRKSNKDRGKKQAEQAIADRQAIQDRCNHHTGGHGPMAVLQGQGDLERPYCIGGQQFLDDVIRLRCERCNAFCMSNDPDRAKWAKWVGMWQKSINKQLMIVGGLKMRKIETPALVA